jgi:hypothetical protein
MTDAAEKMHVARLRSAWKEQDRYKEEIRSLRNELYSLRMCMKMRVAAKQRQTIMKENEIAEENAQCENQIRFIRYFSLYVLNHNKILHTRVIKYYIKSFYTYKKRTTVQLKFILDIIIIHSS